MVSFKDWVRAVWPSALIDNQLPVVAGARVKRFDATFTGIGAYSQYDVVGALTKISDWASANGRSARVIDARISVANNAIVPQFELHFFKTSDPTFAADNVTWTELDADYAKRAGYIQFPACAKAGGSGTIDFVRAQHTDAEYGTALSREISCAFDSSDIWVGLKLMNAAGVSFAAAPGNTIRLVMLAEQS